MSAVVTQLYPAATTPPAPATSMPREAERFLEGYGQPKAVDWDHLPASSRERAMQRQALVSAVELLVRTEGLSVRAACMATLQSLAQGTAAAPVATAAAALGRKGTLPSLPRLQAWWKAHASGGLHALADQHSGRPPKIYGWERQALELHLTPARMDPGAIAFNLKRIGHASATAPRVRAFINALPGTLGRYAPQRLGKHYHQQNLKPYRVLDYTDVAPGLCYQGDGHTCDFWVKHPVTGKPFRPELTVWIDRGSNLVAGWYLWNRESGLNTLFSLTRAIAQHGHVPGAVHVDAGSGFRNRMMCDEVTGQFNRLGIHPIFAITGNARGKGLVEGGFHHFEDRCGKLFPTYCGSDRTDDMLSRMQTKVRRGELQMPEWDFAVGVVGQYFEDLNRHPRARFGGRSPLEVWEAGLQRRPPVVPIDELPHPTFRAKVSHWRITWRKRFYQHQVLADWEGREVQIQVDIFDASRVRVTTLDNRLLCIAERVDRTPALSDNVMLEIERRRADDAVKRKQRQIDEIRARVDGSTPKPRQDVDALEQMFYGLEDEVSGSSGAAATAPEEETSGITLDLTSLDW